MMHTTNNRDVRRRAGFSLVELMVALVAGAIAITSIYYVSAASSRHFHEQQRVAQSQMALRMAMYSLRRDLALAGYGGTPNSEREQRCMTPASEIYAVDLEDGAATAELTEAGTNGVEADVLRLTGNFVTSDRYLAIGLNQSGDQVFLQRNWQAFRRTFGHDGLGDDDTRYATESGYREEVFEDVFREGRFLHIETVNGNHFFVRITGTNAADAAVSFSPNLPIGGTCVGGLADGATVTPITQVEYTVLDMTDDALSEASSTSPLAGMNGPVLVRRELDIESGDVIANSERVILEYVADFDVDFVVDTTATPGDPPNLSLVEDGAAEAIVSAGNNPHRARSARIRLSARNSREDPRFPYVDREDGEALVRYELTADTPGAARVRTMTAEVLLPNLAHRNLRP